MLKFISCTAGGQQGASAICCHGDLTSTVCFQVTIDESQLSHLTRDRVKIPHNRRLPTRGHLLAVVSPAPVFAATSCLIKCYFLH